MQFYCCYFKRHCVFFIETSVYKIIVLNKSVFLCWIRKILVCCILYPLLISPEFSCIMAFVNWGWSSNPLFKVVLLYGPFPLGHHGPYSHRAEGLIVHILLRAQLLETVASGPVSGTGLVLMTACL